MPGEVCVMREEPQPRLAPAAWRDPLARFDRELGSRAAAQGTRRAYGSDLAQFAAWAAERGLDPAAVRYRDLRRYAARLSEGGAAKTTVARKLAAIRGFYGHLLRSGEVGANPADLVAVPKRPSGLPRVLDRDEAAALLDRIPSRTPLEARDRALFELAYSCGLRAAEIV